MMMQAEIECKMHHLGRIYRADNRWQAAAWWLERRFRTEYSLNYTVDNDETSRIVRIRRTVKEVIEQKGNEAKEVMRREKDKIEDALKAEKEDDDE